MIYVVLIVYTVAVDNCLFENKGICHVCKSTYILSYNNRMCYLSPNSKPIEEKCLRYGPNRSCIECHCGYGLTIDKQCVDNTASGRIFNCGVNIK